MLRINAKYIYAFCKCWLLSLLFPLSISSNLRELSLPASLSPTPPPPFLSLSSPRLLGTSVVPGPELGPGGAQMSVLWSGMLSVMQPAMGDGG